MYANAVAGPGWRVFWLKAVLACGLLSGFLLSPKLWLSSRIYPLSPITSVLPDVPTPLDWLWFGALLALLVGIAVTPQSRWLILVFVCLAGLLSLWDQSRWQPWFYHYLFMLSAFAFRFRFTRSIATSENDGARRGRHEAEDAQAILNAGRFIMAATYVWSGLQKCNVSFLTIVYPWLLEPFLPESVRRFAMPAGLVVPFLETGIGLGLLVPALRRLALLLVLAMHAALLYCLGPFGHAWNSIVWPWNLAMMALAGILFWRTQDVSFREIVWPGASAFRWLTLVLFGIMPGLSFLGHWDSYLSAALYSGNGIQAEINISEGVYERIPAGIQRYCSKRGERYDVDMIAWSIGELNVPPYPAQRIYRNIARSFCAAAKHPSDVVLVIHGRPHWWCGIRQAIREDCATLHGTAFDRSSRLE
ncbi:MAG: hypothetical protein HY040_20540 [Planctomycetes bacterium]|nr:hypothetical protein [Planctomycetota bacterium]